MNERKWEDMPRDCLVNIFGRVGVLTMLFDVPVVCKSWYNASLDPQCWRFLALPDFSSRGFDEDIFCNFPDRLMEKFKPRNKASVTAFTKFLIRRSQKTATLLKIPRESFREEVLLFAANECPDLKVLWLPQDLICENDMKLNIHLLCNLSKLDEMLIVGVTNLKEKISQIIEHYYIITMGLRVSSDCARKDEASTIVNVFPKLKYLVLENAIIKRDDLVKILQGSGETNLFTPREFCSLEGLHYQAILDLAYSVSKI